ncbi:hypothetical protein HN51_007394, partial [Arachis hypogaea]
MVTNATSASACPPPMKPTSNGVFQGDNPLDFTLVMATLQICLVFIVTRGLTYIIRLLRQPRIIAETVSGRKMAETRSSTFSTRALVNGPSFGINTPTPNAPNMAWIPIAS